MAFLFTNFNVKCVSNKYVYYETREKMKLKTKELTVCALFAALIAVGAFIKIYRCLCIQCILHYNGFLY